jgi:transcriptional regulator with PAS, ATPase and Fis domain
VDVRIIASTNKKLEDLVSQGKFREDLYYRLNVMKIEIPPLRERREDIPSLIKHFIHRIVKAHALSEKIVSDSALKMLIEYNWPGNVRELEKELERLVLMSGKNGIITEDLISPRIWEAILVAQTEEAKKGGNLQDAITALEKEMITEALIKNNWNKTWAARDLGISRVCLLGKIYSYKLERIKNGTSPPEETTETAAETATLTDAPVLLLAILAGLTGGGSGIVFAF